MAKATHKGYTGAFAAVRHSLPGQGLPWLDSLRTRAIEQFAETGLPTIRDEVWKFTNLRALGRDLYTLAPARENGIAVGDLTPHLPAGLECHRLVFVNGRLRADLSDTGALPQGVRLTNLAQLLDDDSSAIESHFADDLEGNGPIALNTAFMTDGAVLTIDDGVAVERPVHLLYLAAPGDEPAAIHTRNLIVAGAASSATVIESYAAADTGAYWTNAVTDIVAAEDANLRHFKLQGEGAEAFHLAATRARLADRVAYHSFVAQTGARLARNEIFATLGGSNIDCRLTGAYLGRGKQHLDNTTVVDHAEPGSYSNEHYKGVLDGNAHGVFQGKIIVRPDAQKTDAHQLNRNLLLSEASQVDTKPELEIHADDVQCSHGATVGEIDDDALFYLRARGINDDEARQMLVEAFVGEIIDTVSIEPIRDHLRQTVAQWLAAGDTV
jgi:Fe-S cluster assembly protein SufD